LLISPMVWKVLPMVGHAIGSGALRQLSISGGVSGVTGDLC